ncbi:MAG TPA: hypothetical protein VIL46_11525 [Gemmataceae bacterium]
MRAEASTARGRARSLAGAAVTAGVLLAAGCAPAEEPRMPVFPVEGKVTFRGRPAAGAVVVLRPLNNPDDPVWDVGFPRAAAGRDGSFRVTTYGGGDGAPAGEYAVLIEWFGSPPEGGGTGPDEESDPESGAGEEEEDRLGGRYSDPNNPPFKVRIREGPNTVGPFNLK